MSWLAEKYEKNSSSDPHDENGNPLESSPLTSGYRQMREPPALGFRGANPSSKSTYGTVGGFPQTLNSFDFFPQNNHQIKDVGELEDSPSSSKLPNKRKQKKVKEQLSEDIDDYKGNILDIDELVNFVEGKNVDNKKNKKCQPSTIAATATTDIPSKGEKNNMKVKYKKQKSTIPFSATEEENKGKIVIKEGNSDPETSKLEVHSVCESKDCLYKGMGNYSAKTECKLTDTHQKGGTIRVYDEEKLASLFTDSDEMGKHSEEEDKGLGTAKFKQSDTFSLCLPHAEKAGLHSSESDVLRYDEDSGVCNSSKATNSIDSLSDQDASESEGRGCYDCFPQSQVKIHSGGGLHLDDDEVHEVQSDRCSQDVTSPHSDLKIEMTEIVPNRPDNNRDVDFYTDDKSDDDHNIHQSLCSSRSYKGDYNPMHRESKEEYAQFFSPNFEASRGTLGSSAHSGFRSQGQVDEKIAFSPVLGGNIYSRYSNPCPRSELHTSSDKVKIEKNFYPNTTSKPPFGDGQDQLEKVGRSVQPLLDHISDAPTPNMPEARKLVPLFSEDNKKKKKKKKAPKDELDEKYEKNSMKKSDPHDENGKPLESIPLTPGYKQMREPPALGFRGANPSSKSTYGTVGGFPQTLNSFDFFPHNNHQIKDVGELEDSPSSSKLPKKRKQKKVKEQLSEDIDDYKGNILDIDELVNFIAGKNVDNKKNKKCQPSTIAATATTDIPSKGEKNNMKVKYKKQKSTIPFSATEEENKGKIVIKEGNSDPETSKLEVHSVCESKDCLYKGMGNYSAKTECKLTDNHQKGGTIRVYDEEKLASLFTDSDEMGKLNIGSNKYTVISSSIIDLKCPKNNKISTKKDKQAESDISSTANNVDGEVHKNKED